VLLLGVLVAVAVEVAAFVAVASQIGVLLAVVLLVVASALGPMAVRRAGLGVLAHTRERLLRGEVPTRELLDGLVVLAGGVLICVPGFVGDLLGLLLMVGPVRHLVIRTSGDHLARRVRTMRRVRWMAADVPSRPTPGAVPLPPRSGALDRRDGLGDPSRADDPRRDGHG
jgi:UPF0716 protein FxsA